MKMDKKKQYHFPTGETFYADKADLARLLEENTNYYQNYLELLGSMEESEYVARGNGFCDSKFSESFINSQIDKYLERIELLKKWIGEK